MPDFTRLNRPAPVLIDMRGVPVHGQATVNGPATLRSPNTDRRSVLIQNLGSGTLYVGGVGVLTTDGFAIAANDNITLDRCTEGVYVNASGSCDVRFIEETQSAV